MEPVVIPADTSWQQLIYMIVLAVVPVLLGYMEKLRRDLAANTQKTESISHSVNGSLDARLYAMAEDIKRNFGEALAEANQDMERRLDSLDKRLAELERKANS